MNLFVNKHMKFVEINITVLTILLYLFRTTLPFLKFPFLLLFFGLFIYSIINYRNRIPNIINKFYRSFFLTIILSIILILAFFLSNKSYLIVFKDISNSLIIISLFFLMIIIIESSYEFNLFSKLLIKYVIFFSGIISIFLLYNLLYFIPGNNSSLLNKVLPNTLAGSLSSDYNFSIVPIFFGMIGVYFLIIESKSRCKSAILNLLIIFYSFTIILSSSRRGLMLLAIIIILLTCFRLFLAFRKSKFESIHRYNSTSYLISLIIPIFLFMVFVFVVPIQIKRIALNSLGIPIRSYQNVTSNILFRYSTFVHKVKYDNMLKVVWSEKADPHNPDSGWGSQISTCISPLDGENVEIVPIGSKGYKMNSTCNASTWNSNAYSYTNIASLFQGETITKNNEFYFASVYCYVSADFDGSWARISTDGEAFGKTIQTYDLNRKAVWQKLSICFRNKGNISPVYLYWSKNDVTNFANLKGYIMFAYPEYGIISTNPKDPETGWGINMGSVVFPLTGMNVEMIPENSIGYKMDNRTNASSWSNNAYSYTDISVLLKEDSTDFLSQTYTSSVYCYLSEDFDGTWARLVAEGGALGNTIQEYDIMKKGTWQRLQIDFIGKSGTPPVYLYWAKYGVTDFSSLKGFVIFAYPEYNRVFNKDNVFTGIKTEKFINSKDFAHKFIAEYEKDQLFYYRFIKSISQNGLNGIRNEVNIEFAYSNKNNIVSNQPNNILNCSGFLSSSLPLIANLLLSGVEKDPIRRLASRFISEDTTYFGYKNKLLIDTTSNNFMSDRVVRWKFAIQVYRFEYNWKQKIYGGGFNFLNWFGYRFVKDKTYSDYPHNPFLSILLYSGIIGLLIYLFFLFNAVYYYIKYCRKFPILFIFFSITFSFSFFSAGSPFDPPMMGFFMVLPFFINHIQKH